MVLVCFCKVIMSLVKCKEKMSPLRCNRIIHELIRNYLKGGRNTDGGDNFEAAGSK
jgi:hypothetical protein